MNSHRRRLSSTAPVPERPATKSSKSGIQNVFWTSTARRQRRKESSAAGPKPCFLAHASASLARSSYGTRQTSPTRLGSKCFGSCSSRIAPPVVRLSHNYVPLGIPAQPSRELDIKAADLSPRRSWGLDWGFTDFREHGTGEVPRTPLLGGRMDKGKRARTAAQSPLTPRSVSRLLLSSS